MATRFSAEQKRDIVLALVSARATVTELAREHQISTQTIYNWRDHFLEAGLAGLKGRGPSKREQELERENTRLKQLVGDISLANYTLKGGARGSTGSNGGMG